MSRNDLFQKAINGDVKSIIQYLETYCPEKWGDNKQKTGDDTKWQNTKLGKRKKRERK